MRTQAGREAPFIRNEELSLPGFRDKREAELAAETIPQSPSRRVRVSFRSRTGTYDVVVKDRQASADPE